jgi:hypothetical protein
MISNNRSRPKTRSGLTAIALLGFAANVLAAPAAKAASSSVTTDYQISLAGLSIAKASFVTRIDGSNFDISGQFATSGLARIVKRIQGTATVSGMLKGDAFVANAYETRYLSGHEQKSYDVSFSNGKVTGYHAHPNRETSPDWVALTPEDLARAVDPLSGLIVPANTQICQGTVPIFDGEMRTNLSLYDKGTRPFSAGGKMMDARVCGFKVSPKSGFRKGKNDMDYVARLKDMEIWFAKSTIANVYAPVKIKISTGFGSFIISAVKIGA